MVDDCYYGKKLDGSGAHKIASIITPMYIIFRFFDNGDTSSNGFALGFLVLNTRINIAINQ